MIKHPINYIIDKIHGFLLKVRLFVVRYKLLSSFAFIFVSGNALVKDYRYDLQQTRDNVIIEYSRAKEDKLNNIIDSFRLESSTQKKMLQAFIIDRISDNKELEDFELPVWKKVEVGGVFVTTYVNKAYEKDFLFGNSRFKLMGNTSYIVFPKKYFDIYQNNDKIAKESDTIVYFTEPTWNPLDKEGFISVAKWRDKTVNNGEVVIWGVSLKRNKHNEKNN